jgi:hypothetical protein
MDDTDYVRIDFKWGAEKPLACFLSACDVNGDKVVTKVVLDDEVRAAAEMFRKHMGALTTAFEVVGRTIRVTAVNHYGEVMKSSRTQAPFEFVVS